MPFEKGLDLAELLPRFIRGRRGKSQPDLIDKGFFARKRVWIFLINFAVFLSEFG